MSEPVTKTMPIALSHSERLLWNFVVAKNPTMREMIDHLYGNAPDGGPEHARNCIRSLLTRINRKLSASRIECRNGHYSEVPSAPTPHFPKSTRRPRKPTLAPLPWDNN